MIVSDVHKYIYVQIPHTGSTTIGEELIEHYDGRPVLSKHSYPHELFRKESKKYRDYYLFASIRNPLDERVSIYYKLKTNHLGLYAEDAYETYHNVNNSKVVKERKWRTFLGKNRYEFCKDPEVTFEDYFLRYCYLSYNNPICILKERYSKILRFESLSDDFHTALSEIGITPKRHLPHGNRTSKNESWENEYKSSRSRKRARHLYQPFMASWGYCFPKDWGIPAKPNLSDEIAFRATTLLRKSIWWARSH